MVKYIDRNRDGLLRNHGSDQDAGIVHKNINSSQDFICVGSYPTDISYEMQHKLEGDPHKMKEQIAKAPLPEKDPVFGDQGPVLEFWKMHNLTLIALHLHLPSYPISEMDLL